MIRTTREDLINGLHGDRKSLKAYSAYAKTIARGGVVENLTLENALSVIESLKACIANKKKLLVGSEVI